MKNCLYTLQSFRIPKPEPHHQMQWDNTIPGYSELGCNVRGPESFFFEPSWHDFLKFSGFISVFCFRQYLSPLLEKKKKKKKKKERKKKKEGKTKI